MNSTRLSVERHPGVADLPICDVLESVSRALEEHDQLIVEAPPGAGKTTIIPLALLDSFWLRDRKIIMLQPRRIAARNAATRMADLLDERPGETVGYRMRLESRVGPATRIEVVTEGILLRMLAEDPSLEDVGLLIFDEFHERSLDCDLGLALALHGRGIFEREQASKLLVMSATLEQKELGEYLSAPVVRSEGRAFPVTVHYRPARNQRDRIADRVTSAIEDAIARHPESSVLVFLPGQGEINQVAKALSPPSDVTVFPLLGSLSVEEQQRAIAPLEKGKRKVVLATNVAETSLTIEGVDVVIDSGLERRPVFDPNTGMSRLHTVQISRASAEQRRGRAGRLAPGTCYRLWSESQQEQRSAHLAPEIEEADLADLVLQLFDWGVYEPSELRWLTPPPTGPYQQAVDLLITLGAAERTDDGLALTSHGSAMAVVATHPRLAHMLIASAQVGAIEQGALLAAVLSDRDPLRQEGPDMETRLEYLQEGDRCPARYRGWRQRTRQLARQLRSRIDAPVVTQLARPTSKQLTGYLLACAYPERIARRRHNGGYQLANGRSAKFAEPNRLEKSRWLAVAETGGLAGQRGDAIYSASVLDPALFETLLADLLVEETSVDWDKQSGRFVAERRVRCGALVFTSEPLKEVPEAERVQKLLDVVREQRLKNLPWDKATESFLNRARQFRALSPEFPDLSEDALLATMDDWLAPYLGPVKRLTDLKKLDLLGALKARLSWEQQQELDRQLPQRFTVPSGSSITIDYEQTPPVLAVKLQEMFGCAETPAVANGRLPLVVHLLSPAGRPLQVTLDIASFWQDGYKDVRKEMRGRYPKHPWPEDPLTSQATRYTKRRLSGD